MTASIENALKSFTLLKQELVEADYPRLATMADSAGKCLNSLASQVAFYESRKAGEAAPDGNTAVAVLRSPRFPGALTVYGETAAIERLKIILAEQKSDLWLF